MIFPEETHSFDMQGFYVAGSVGSLVHAP